jgi:hypothetical protein
MILYIICDDISKEKYIFYFLSYFFIGDIFIKFEKLWVNGGDGFITN